MLRQLLVSIAVSCNIAIHAIVMAAVLWVARVASERAMSHRSFRLATVVATVSVLMAARILKWPFWSVTYWMVGVVPSGTDLIYFAFVNTQRSVTVT